MRARKSKDPYNFDELLDGLEDLLGQYEEHMRARNTVAKPLRYAGDGHTRDIVVEVPPEQGKVVHRYNAIYEWPDGSRHEVPRHCVQPDSEQLRRQLRLESWE